MDLSLHKIRVARREDGMALIVALGAMLVLAIAGTSVVHYSSANTRSSSYSRASGASFQLAEAGLHEALAVLSNQPTNDPANPSLLSTRTSTYSTGSVTWGGTYDSSIAKWTITSTGKVANPSNVPPSQATRTITAKVPIRPVTSQSTESESWNYVFSYSTGDSSGCDMSTTSSVSVETRLLVTGNLCVKDSSRIEGSATQVLVGGQTKIYGSATIGSSSVPINRIDSAQGCRYELTTAHNPCTTADKVWATTATSSPALLSPPNPDYAYWYANSSPGPTENCTGANRSGTPPTWDNDMTQNRSAPTANLTPGSSYVCRTYLGTEPLGELSWNNSTKTLTVRGTIFIDGNVQITQAGLYTGRATLYAAGSFYIGGSNRMCAVAVGSPGTECNFTTGAGRWDPNTTLLAIVTKGAGGSPVDADATIKLDGSSQWQGALYGGPYRASVLSSSRFAGPLIAGTVFVDSSLQMESFTTIVSSPTGLPGNSTIYAKPDKLELFSG